MKPFFRKPLEVRTLAGRWVAMVIALCVFLAPRLSGADIRDPSSREFRGMYKITSSNDPIFPTQAGTEWFLDFGKGIGEGRFSGDVAVSMRRNPNVRVRIMAWQYFPKQGLLVIGNPYSEGSRNAVAKGSWRINPDSGGFSFTRGNYEVAIRRTDPADY